MDFFQWIIPIKRAEEFARFVSCSQVNIGKQIKETPILKGHDARRFLANMKMAASKRLDSSSREKIKANYSKQLLSVTYFLENEAYRESLVFYQKNGFQFLTDGDKFSDTRQMYFDLILL